MIRQLTYSFSNVNDTSCKRRVKNCVQDYISSRSFYKQLVCLKVIILTWDIHQNILVFRILRIYIHIRLCTFRLVVVVKLPFFKKVKYLDSLKLFEGLRPMKLKSRVLTHWIYISNLLIFNYVIYYNILISV